jgi:hypothetical protein
MEVSSQKIFERFSEEVAKCGGAGLTIEIKDELPDGNVWQLLYNYPDSAEHILALDALCHAFRGDPPTEGVYNKVPAVASGFPYGCKNKHEVSTPEELEALMAGIGGEGMTILGIPRIVPGATHCTMISHKRAYVFPTGVPTIRLRHAPEVKVSSEGKIYIETRLTFPHPGDDFHVINVWKLYDHLGAPRKAA